MSKQKVIFDTDAGVDDSWALITLLKCEERLNLDVKAITVLTGNTQLNHGCQNMLLILKTLNRMDVNVYAGSENSIIPKPIFLSEHHGNDGLKDVIPSSEKPSIDLIQKKHAVEAMKDIIEENPNEVIIFAVGPLTNIALLYKLYPRISSKIKALHVMGGNFMGIGNITRCAEFNFWFDPEAARIVLTETKCPLNILPWEVCLKASEATPHQEWRFGVLNKVKSAIVDLMDLIERDPLKKIFIPCDAYLIACFAFPNMILKKKHHSATVELSGEYARGLMVLDHKLLTEPNAHVIEEIDVEIFKKVLLWICGHEDSGI